MATKPQIITRRGKITDIAPTLTTRPSSFVINRNFNTGIEKTIADANNDELWKLYALSTKELRRRKLIRSRNIVGEYGEQVAINFYNTTQKETKLQASPIGTRNMDAIGRSGERYSIKTIVYPNRTTGVFYGLESVGSKEKDDKKFEYVVIVVIDEDFQVLKILELDWNAFVKCKKWHSRMNAWNLSLTKDLESSSRVVFNGIDHGHNVI